MVAHSPNAVILVQLSFQSETPVESYLAELKELALSAGLTPVAIVRGARRQADPKYCIGSGKVQEIEAFLAVHKGAQVLVNHTLSPTQKRNLERALQTRVLDRTELILEIFARRARTFEGKLQVELAQLQYLSTRLVRGWTHLERQKGGIGLRGGPGETQLEVDKRLIKQRIRIISARLEKVRTQRSLGRRARKQAELSTVSLVGYTNAGKSTLFNRLTRSSTYVAGQLFATLDPTLRRCVIPDFGPVIVADTVGFIRDLPHHLVDAFRATLEETLEADLLLHVVDAAQPERELYMAAVDEVLIQIGAAEIPRLIVYNKLDQLEPERSARIDFDSLGQPKQVWVSALTGEGISLLQKAIAGKITVS